MDPQEYATLMKVLRGETKLVAPQGDDTEQAGPPSPTIYPPQQIEGREPEEKLRGSVYASDKDFVKSVGPVMLAHLLDGITTEMFLRTPNQVSDGIPSDKFQNGKIWYEKNPLPGMDSTAGRLGWSFLWQALIGSAKKNHPKAGKIAEMLATNISSNLARSNLAKLETGPNAGFGFAKDRPDTYGLIQQKRP